MKILKDITHLKLNNTAVAIGKFDGIHKGHRLIMDELINSKKEGLTAVVFTFSKSPYSVVNHSNSKYILTNSEKYSFYEKIGVDIVIEYPMTEELILMDREVFLKNILIEKLDMKKIICGNDFCFGHNRLGNIEFLEENSKTYDYQLKVFEKLLDNEKQISSTLVRNLISEGDIEKANALLGYPYTIIGKVIHGNEIGRTIDFPTANIVPGRDKILPPNGVYFSTTNISGKEYYCVTNIGSKPTVTNEKNIIVETNVLDFKGNLYDSLLEIRLYKFHRSEVKFENLEALKKQIMYDAGCCRDYFNKLLDLKQWQEGIYGNKKSYIGCYSI